MLHHFRREFHIVQFTKRRDSLKNAISVNRILSTAAAMCMTKQIEALGDEITIYI